MVTDLHFRSMCPHHLMPYSGLAHLAYVPGREVVGFGRLSALIDVFAHRLVLQEELARQVALSLQEELGTQGAACLIRAEQTCFRLRGEEQHEAVTYSEAYEGRLRDDRELRRELVDADRSREVSAPLEGRVALVTGASRGIGREILRALHDAGARVFGTSTTAEGAARIEREMPGARGLVCDVANPSAVDEAVKAAGAIDVLVNNAGVVQRAPLAEVSDADFDRVLAVNLSGPYYFARRVIPGMVARRWGRIVNVSSISATLGSPKMASYCASKWGLNGLTKSLAEELKGTGVTVTAVLPGSVDTEMLKGSGFPPAMTAEEVARLVRFLCAEAPEAMTGSLVEMFG